MRAKNLVSVEQWRRDNRPSGSVFAYCKRSETGARKGLGTRLGLGPCSKACL